MLRITFTQRPRYFDDESKQITKRRKLLEHGWRFDASLILRVPSFASSGFLKCSIGPMPETTLAFVHKTMRFYCTVNHVTVRFDELSDNNKEKRWSGCLYLATVLSRNECHVHVFWTSRRFLIKARVRFSFSELQVASSRWFGCVVCRFSTKVIKNNIY